MSTGRLERSSDRLRGTEHIETIVISNGEQPLLSASGRKDGGAAARVIEIWGAPFASAGEADALSAIVSENYGHAGGVFANAIMKLGAGELRSRYHGWREQARQLGTTDVARRRGDAMAVLMLAAEIASEILLLPPVRTQAWTEIMSSDAGREGSDDLAAAALEALWNELTFNESIFWNKDSTSIVSSFDRPRDGWKGRYDKAEDWLAVKPDWLDEFLMKRGFDANGIRNQWADREWISRDPKGKRTVIIRISGGTARCVKVTHRPEGLSSDSHSDGAKGFSED
jgi:hypothetical protein